MGIGGGGIVAYKPTTGESVSLVLRNSIVAGNGASTAGSEGNLITGNAPNACRDPPRAGVVKSDDPQLGPTLNTTSAVLGHTGVEAYPGASDATSGVATASCGSVDTTAPGAHTVLCTATDNAGNTASASLTHVVEYRILGFFSPVPLSKWRLGQTVPVKIALGDIAATRILDAEGRALASEGRVTFSAVGAQTKIGDGSRCDQRDSRVGAGSVRPLERVG